MSFNIMNNIDYRVGIYIRLSKEDEEKEKYSESESVQNQRTVLMQYIKENKFNFVAEYVDDGVSGTSFDRPAFNKMIDDIEQGKINMVITKDLSRLGRNYVQSGYYTETYFPEHNVRYIAILDNIDTALDSANNDIAPFKSILNEMYAKDTSKKINSVLQSKRNNGEYLGTVPYGYEKDPENKYHLVIDEEAAEVVEEQALRSGSFYVNKRWLGGLLTNFRTIQKRIKRLVEIEEMEASGKIEVYTKKEQANLRKEKAKLEGSLGGIKEMKKLPDALVVIDPKEEHNAIAEAKKLGIPVFAMLDTNCDPEDADFAIASNDDAVRSIKLVTTILADAIVDAKGGLLEMAYLDETEDDVTMEDVIKNVEAQIAENERRRRQRNEERRKRNFERKNRRPFNKKNDDVKPAAKAEEAKAAE